MTSKAPGSGTSISSIWNASLGSPSRSSRITHAAIVSGSVPGSTSSSDTLLTSTAMLVSALRFVWGGEDIGVQDRPRRADHMGVPAPRVFYLCPDHDAPAGGIRVIYRHVDILNEA